MEVLHSDGSPWCSLPNLPEERAYHTQNGLEACGGIGLDWDYTTPTLTSCVRFSGGVWSPSHQMVEQRWHHTSWASPAGTLLMGGIPNWDTTELLDAATGDSVMSFPLKYDVG